MLIHVLVVEDDLHLQAAMVAFLKADNAALTIDVAGSVAEAKKRLALKEYSVVVLDIGLPDGGGFEVLDAIRAGIGWTPTDARVAIYSALEPDCVADISVQRGANVYYPKSEVGIMLLRGWAKVAVDGVRSRARRRALERLG